MLGDEAPPFNVFVPPDPDLACVVVTSRRTDRTPLCGALVPPVLGLACVGVTLRLTLLATVVFCLRSSTTVGASEPVGAGVVACGAVEALAGEVVDGTPVPASRTPGGAS